MKTKILVSTMLLNFSVAGAQEITPVSGQFAVLKPNLSCEITVPQGRSSSQVYFSKDCQTAYVLPSLNMKKTILKPYFIADTGICNRYEQVKKSLAGIESKITKLESQIAKLENQYVTEDDSAALEVLAKKMAYLKKQKEDFITEQDTRLNPFYDTAAVRTQIRVESDLMDEVAAFQAANIANVSNGAKVYPTRFVPAQITSGILAITATDPTGYRGRSVLKASFPGTKFIPTKEESEFYEKNSVLINMNGSLSGIVDLSAVTYCAALNENDQSLSTNEQNLRDAFTAAVALNYDYQVKVQAGIRIHMKSSLETRDFLSQIQNKVVNSAFERNEFFGALVEGGLMDNLDIQLDDKGEQYNLSEVIFGATDEEADDTKSMIAPLIGKFIKTHLDKMENKLEQLGVLKKIDAARVKEIKAGTTTETAGYNTICSSKSSWFGMSRKTSCRTEPIYVQVNHDGISTLLEQNVDNSKIESEVTVETNQTILVRHSSTFGKN